MNKAISCVLILVIAASIAYAQPNALELRGWQALVADYSETSGGSEPAITQGGRALAYRSSNGDIWTLGRMGPEARNAVASARARRLSFKPGEEIRHVQPNNEGLRNIDWAVDTARDFYGPKLAFVYKDGRLYVAAEVLSETPTIRAIAEARPIEGEETAGGFQNPRWSPDGKKIAVMRSRSGGAGYLCVIDAESGRETVVAKDAMLGACCYGQPWSPDGQHLVYTMSGSTNQPRPDETYNAPTDIVIVSADGKDRRSLTRGGSSTCPSWSRMNQIAYIRRETFETTSPAEMDRNGDQFTVAHIIGPDGKNDRTLCDPPIPTTKEFNAWQDAIDAKRIEWFEAKYRSKLSGSQLAELRAGKMESERIEELAILLAAEDAGPGFLDKLKQRAAAGRTSPLLASEPLTLNTVFNEAKVAGGESSEQQRKFYNTLLAYLMEPVLRVPVPRAGTDCGPVWSFDGKSVAILRRSPLSDVQELVVVRAEDGKQRTVLSAAQIDCVSWTVDYKRLVAQTRRTMSRNETDEDRADSPGYPEIWMLELR